MKHLNYKVVFAVAMIVILLIPATLFLLAPRVENPYSKQLNRFPPNIMMKIAPATMQRSAACSGPSILARVTVNATVAYWFHGLCRVPSGWQIWDSEQLVWSLLKRVEIA